MGKSKMTTEQIIELIEHLTGFDKDQRVGWYLTKQEEAIDQHIKIGCQIFHGIADYLDKLDTDHGKLTNLYDYDFEKSKTLLNGIEAIRLRVQNQIDDYMADCEAE